MSSPVASPVFVIGLFRSGTSLLYSLLNRHPRVALMYECDVWDLPGAFSGLRFRPGWLERLEFYNRALSRHRLIFGGSLRGLEEMRTPEELYQAYGRGKGATLWGEKSPGYVMRLHPLARRYPRAFFVLIWRDPVEIYRSVRQAGRGDPFFRRPGMLSRLIHYQEQMIAQAARLELQGMRLCHVNYDELVDQPEIVCRRLCQFLGIEFDGAMLNLRDADFSAIYRGENHEHLRRGVIARRRFPNDHPDPAISGKLRRFQSRWNRLRGEYFGHTLPAVSGEPGPGPGERLYHGLAGALLVRFDTAKRLLFEFLPLAWLRAYRRLKSRLLARQSIPVVAAAVRHEGGR